jgi:penicillin-binding protein 1A
MFVCTVFLAGCLIVLHEERAAIKGLDVSTDDLLTPDRKGQSLAIYTADGKKIYEKISETTSPMPKSVSEELMFLVRFAGEEIFQCDRPVSEDEKLLKFYEIPDEGLKNCINHYLADKALGRQSKQSRSKLAVWKTVSELIGRYGQDKLLRYYMESAYMQNDIWGLEAASKTYFGTSTEFITLPQKVWLVSVMVLGRMPEENLPEFTKMSDMLVYRLYLKRLISYERYSEATGAKVSYGMHREINLMPGYTELVLQELKEKNIRTDRQLVVRTNFSAKTIDAAQEAVNKKLKEYPKGVNIALAVVNYETGGVEALAANDRWQYRTIKMRRQIGSTFKPIVYLTAVSEGVSPNEMIVDKRYKYNLGNYVYSPANFEDYYMGNIPVRLGLVFSLNNATIRLAKMTGLARVGKMAKDMGMAAKIEPFLAMPLGVFPTTPLNLAKVYSVFGTYGIKNDIGYISQIEDINGDKVYFNSVPPVRVSDERRTYQVLYMMTDVVRRGTAKGSGLIWGTAAKTGTTDEYRDAWTVAIFPPYSVVCWVGFDDHRSMGDKGTGGGRAAPVIAEFQKIVTNNAKKIDFNVPEGVVFRNVDKRTGMVVDEGCSSKSSYLEAFLEEEVPASCIRKKIASGTDKNKGS